MNNLMMLKDLLKDKQFVLAVYGQILMDLKAEDDIKKLIQSILLQESLHVNDIMKLLKSIKYVEKN